LIISLYISLSLVLSSAMYDNKETGARSAIAKNQWNTSRYKDIRK
jgi:hypothetical protein